MGPGSAPALFGPTLRCPSRLIHAIDPPPVPMVLMSIIGMRTGYAPTAPPLVTCGLPPLHDEERLVLQAEAEFVVHAIEIAFHVRLDEGVDQGRDRALVLAIFGQHRAGERQRAVGIVLREDVRDTALVGGIGIGMDEADADRADALPAEELRGGVHTRLVQRANFLAAEIQAPADLAHEMERHDALRLHPEIGIAVAHGYRLAGNLQEM